MRPTWASMWSNYPHKYRAPALKTDALYRSIGWDDLIDKPAFENTCAVRTSMALQRSGIDVKSSAGMRALKGDIKGKQIEIRFDDLANQLKKSWGPPEVLAGSAVDQEAALGDRNGVAVFWKLPPNQYPGHIDVVDGKGTFRKIVREYWNYAPDIWPFYDNVEREFNAESECGTHCYWGAETVWFWELK